MKILRDKTYRQLVQQSYSRGTKDKFIETMKEHGGTVYTEPVTIKDACITGDIFCLDEVYVNGNNTFNNVTIRRVLLGDVG